MSRVYVALDLETTGLEPEHDAILEIGVVKFRGEEILDTWSSLVDPQRRIPYHIQQLTGIAQEEVDRAPSLSSLLGPLRRFVGSTPLVGHSIGFDLAFLKRHGLFTDNLALDTFELASILLPHVARYSLQRLAEELDIPTSTHHRALDDALTAARLFQALREQANRLSLAIIHEIGRLGERSSWPAARFFQDVERSRRRSTSTGAGEQMVAKGTLDGQGLAQFLGRLEEDEPPLQPAAQPRALDTEALARMLEQGGVFARQFPGYEHRPQQIEMLRAVAEAFNQGRHLLVEAGTGVGKSIAYLLPAVYFAAKNSEHVVISTNTINLQDQLYHKDIPDLKRLLDIEFQAALVKGRGNYLCLSRLDALRNQSQLSLTEAKVLAKILVWLPSTLTGDRAELFLPEASERAVWAKVRSEPDSCLGERCRYWQQGQCFFYEARRRAESAHLIVVNHALLLADIAVENRVLPEYRYLIVDEAHNLEDSVTRQLSFEVDREKLEEMLTSLSQEVAPGRYVGLLTQLSLRLQDILPSQDLYSQVSQHIRGVQRSTKSARAALYDLFNGLRSCLSEYHRPGQKYDQRIRLTGGVRVQPAWDQVEIVGDNFTLQLEEVAKKLHTLLEGLESLTECDLTPCEDLLQGLLLWGGQIQSAYERLRPLFFEPSENMIYWATIHLRDEHISLHAAPLHVGELVERHLFLPKKAVVMTSATLRAGGGFDYIRERLHGWDADELAVGSPFDYPSSTLLYLPNDIPEPNQPYYQKRVEAALTRLCRATGGRTLALFTSYSQLNRTARAINHHLGQEDISVFAQGRGTSRQQLLENFRTTPRSVLLGTSSFWEGVDVAGEALSCLVIAKLPFSVPSDPIFAARSETFEDPFGQYAVPQAILRFRQGFGRLIRSKTDRGIVVVLDRRVQSKFYGRAFLDSLPECTIRQGPLAKLPKVAKEWLDRRR
ncbi:MAG: helicase C-terminal domain-containing protein [Chloroflexota bacterium]|nr:helicase C-terminal domain-containing protein [Chloroflexota bacterium]